MSVHDYLQGLRHLPQLLRRLSWRGRSLGEELQQATLRGTLCKTFGFWELLLLGLGLVISNGPYNFRGLYWMAGPSVIISYLLGGIASLLTALIYGEFVQEYPVSGGGFTFTMLSFGELPAWLAGSSLVMAYVVEMSEVAGRLATQLQLLSGFSATYVVELGGEGSGWRLDFFALGAVLLATLVLCLGAKEYSYLVSGFTLVKLAALATVIVAAFTKADPANLQPFLLTNGEAGAGLGGMFNTAAVCFGVTYLGYDALTNAAEEARRPAEDLPPAMVAMVLVGMLFYVPLAASLALLATYSQMATCCSWRGMCTISRIYLNPCESCPEGVGMPWVEYCLAVSGLTFIAAGLLVGLFSLARLVMVMARDGLLPGFLARVYPRTQTPVAAQCTVGAVSGVIALVMPISSLQVLVVFGFLFTLWWVSAAHLCRRYCPSPKLRYTQYGTVEEAGTQQGELPKAWCPGAKLPSRWQRPLLRLHMLLVAGSSLGLALYWQLHGGWGALGLLGAWALATLSMRLACPLAYQPPSAWAVPAWAMPWLPSTCVMLTTFSMGCQEASEMWKVGAFLGATLAVYLLYSLPASWAKRCRLDHVNTELLSVLELKDGQWVCATTGSGAPLSTPRGTASSLPSLASLPAGLSASSRASLDPATLLATRATSRVLNAAASSPRPQGGHCQGPTALSATPQQAGASSSRRGSGGGWGGTNTAPLAQAGRSPSRGSGTPPLPCTPSPRASGSSSNSRASSLSCSPAAGPSRLGGMHNASQRAAGQEGTRGPGRPPAAPSGERAVVCR